MALSLRMKNSGMCIVWLFILLCFIAEHDSRPIFRRSFTTNTKQTMAPCNSTKCLKEKKEMKQYHRLLTIQRDISNALNKSKLTPSSSMYQSVAETPASITPQNDKKPSNSSLVLLQSSGTKKKNILKFNVRPGEGHTKVISAYLLVVIKRRPNKKSKQPDNHQKQRKRRNKRVTIKIHEVNATSGEETLLQKLKTRVKRSYMQNFKLPTELLQRYVDMDQSNTISGSPSNVLQLKVSCSKCGKSVKPFLASRSRKRKQVRSLNTRYVLKPFIVLKQYTTS